MNAANPVGNDADVMVIGAGIVGLASAFRLVQRHPRLKVLVIEKERQVAAHQTGHNSGVMHSGLYYRPGSYRARNCVTGREQLVAFAVKHGVAHEVCGKVVVAVDAEEDQGLQRLADIGLQNGLDRVELITAARLRQIEPHCAGRAALWVPYTGIIDYPGVCRALREQIVAAGSQVRFTRQVTHVRRDAHRVTVVAGQERLTASHLINCGGLQSDRIARLDGVSPGVRVVGFRGDFYDLTQSARKKVRNLIYPVPNPAVPFLGVHFTRMVDGSVECGPNAVFTFKREGYGKLDFDIRDTASALTFPGTWRLFRSHAAFGLGEYRRAFSKRRFHAAVRRLVPDLAYDELVPARSGVRAIALRADGKIADDFVFKTTPRSVHVLNAPSPAATACLAIGDQVVDRLELQL